MKEDNLKSKSETIGVPEQKGLISSTQQLAGMLTKSEFLEVMSVYKCVIDRLCKENGVSLM